MLCQKKIIHHLTIFFEILRDQQLGRYSNHTKFSIYNLCPQGYTINQGSITIGISKRNV